MSELQELIQKLCPDGVEYKKLEDIGDFFGGLTGKSKEDFKDGNSKFITYRNVYANPSLNIDFEDKVKISDNEKQHTVTYGDILFTGSSETPDECGMSSVVTTQTSEKLYLNSFCFGLRLYKMEEFNLHYLKHILRSNDIREQIKKTASGVTRYNVSKKRFAKIYIPVPPIEVQTEIAHILDDFTDLAAELQAELQARKEQYEYYRDKLLSFNNINEGCASVTWMKMSEIGTFIRGKRFVRTDIVSNGVPCIHYGDMYTYYGLYATQSKGRLRSELASKMRYAQKNDVVIVAAGENKEDIGVGLAWLGDEPAAVHDACFIFRSNLYPQYVSHYLRSNYYHKQIVKYVSEGKICSISAKGLGNAIIPIPAHEEQVRIATLLNKFDALVSDLVQGLPAEIAAVQEQYEYYRDKLLSFPKYKLSA